MNELETKNLIQKLARATAFAERHDRLAMKMLRGETNADGSPITETQLQDIAAEIRAQFPYFS